MGKGAILEGAKRKDREGPSGKGLGKGGNKHPKERERSTK